MGNEEKILQILTQMQADISGLKQGQESLRQDVSGLKQGQERLEQIVLRMENEHGSKIGALFDSYSLNLDLTKQLEPRVSKLEDTVEDHVIRLNVLSAAK